MEKINAVITKSGILDMQVCVPKDWSDDQVRNFAEANNPCGTTTGWHIRQEGNDALKGDPERVQCSNMEGYVHVMLEA